MSQKFRSLASFCSFCFILPVIVANQQDVGNSIIDKLNARQIIRAFGFPSEEHTIKTPDGYLLELHRIPHGRLGPSTRKPHLPPVFFQHGLLCTSAVYLLIGPDDALPFLLADMGFDVWLGNVRGNSYSRAHVTLNPDEFQFWNYTWHDSALDDMPTQIDFVLNQTEKEKLVYVGHSMGTTVFFVLMSLIPEYNKKIELAMLMAPIAYLGHTTSPIFNLLAFSHQFFDLAMSLGIGEFLPQSKVFEFIGEYFCEQNNANRDVCGNFIHLLTGDDPRAYDKEFMDVMLKNYPMGYSVKAIHHYVQLVLSDTFRMYDYGWAGNMRQYGVPSPPKYDVKSITAPMIFYEGKSDSLAELIDVKRLVKEVTSLKHLYIIKYCKFGHADFLFSRHVKEYLYNKVIQDLVDHLNLNVTVPI